MKLGVQPDRVLQSMLNDRMVAKGLILQQNLLCCLKERTAIPSELDCSACACTPASTHQSNCRRGSWTENPAS